MSANYHFALHLFLTSLIAFAIAIFFTPTKEARSEDPFMEGLHTFSAFIGVGSILGMLVSGIMLVWMI